jgi:hypothetical protein
MWSPFGVWGVCVCVCVCVCVLYKLALPCFVLSLVYGYVLWGQSVVQGIHSKCVTGQSLRISCESKHLWEIKKQLFKIKWQSEQLSCVDSHRIIISWNTTGCSTLRFSLNQISCVIQVFFRFGVSLPVFFDGIGESKYVLACYVRYAQFLYKVRELNV